MRRHLLLLTTALAFASACADARSHAELMADATADMEAVRLERAMARFDSARTAAPADAEAHRQFARLAQYFYLSALAAEAWERIVELEPRDAAAWDGLVQSLSAAGIFESDRRYGEKLLQVLPEALRNASGRPVVYARAQQTAQALGELEAYTSILEEHHGKRPGHQVLLHHLGAAQVALADLKDGNRSRMLKDSLEAVLDELGVHHDEITDAEAPILYRLAAGYNLLGWEEEKNHWLARLESAPDRGVLADDLRYWNLYFGFQNLLRGPSRQESIAEMMRIAGEGLTTSDLGRRARWVELRSQAIERQARRSLALDDSRTAEKNSIAAEPPGPALAPDIAQAVFDAEMDVIRWRTWRKTVSPLRSLLYYGIQPETVLEKAIELADGLRADRPGYIYPGSRGDEREGVRREMIDAARVLQARALEQLGKTGAAGELFEEIAMGSPGGESLGEYGRHLLRTDRPEEALDILVDAVAYEGSGYRGAAEEAATAAGLSAVVVEERLAARGPLVRAERERRALGERLERAAPGLVLSDQNDVEWRLGDLTGKVVVLRFWATWCGHSLAELPHFAGLVEKYEGDEGVTFLTVATAGSPREAVNQLLSENGYTFPVLFDDEGGAQDFEILGYPTTFYLDPDGLIQYKRQGFVEAGYERETTIRIDALRRPEAQATGGAKS